MGLIKIKRRPFSHNTKRINLRHKVVIATFDMFKICNLGDTGMLVELEG